MTGGSKRALTIAAAAMASVLSAMAIWSVVAPPKREAAPTASVPPTPSAPVLSAPKVIAPAESTTVYMNPNPIVRKPDPRGSVFARASALAKSGDGAGARMLLEPRVFGSSHATDDELHLLRGICTAQHDTKCLASIAWRYAE